MILFKKRGIPRPSDIEKNRASGIHFEIEMNDFILDEDDAPRLSIMYRDAGQSIGFTVCGHLHGIAGESNYLVGISGYGVTRFNLSMSFAYFLKWRLFMRRNTGGMPKVYIRIRRRNQPA